MRILGRALGFAITDRSEAHQGNASPMRRVGFSLLVCAAVIVTACDRVGFGTRDCRTAQFPYRNDIELGAADAGKSVTTSIGSIVGVTLLGDQATRWDPIELDGGAFTFLVNPAGATTIGTRLAELCATSPGEAVLRSRAGSREWTVRLTVTR